MSIITATYLIETAYPLEQAAEMLAGEQSSGTFVRTPNETNELRATHGAKVLSIDEIAQVDQPSLSGAKVPPRISQPLIRRAKLSVAFPYVNIGPNLSVLMSTLAGNLYELAPFSGLKLLDLDVPDEFISHYKGPQFGISGTRKLTGVYDRPVIGTIIKPSVGLSPETTAQQVLTLIEAGLDFIKDDELMGDPPHSPFEKRVEAVMAVINRYADQTGKKPMYAFNLSGDMDDMLRRHDVVLQAGGTCVMVNLNWVGISGVNRLCTHSQLPVHGHRNGWGAMTRSEVLGMEFMPYQKLWRLAGVDHIHTNGIRNKFCETDESVIRSIQACLTPFKGGYAIMPVISSGQWAEQALDTYRAIDSTDVMYLCGGGITAHPDGMGAGVKSIQLGWEGAVQGLSIYDMAPHHPELQHAIDFYAKDR